MIWLLFPAAYLLAGFFWVALSVRDTRRLKQSVSLPGLLLLFVAWPVLLIREVFRG